MKILNIIISLTICLVAHAQRDFQLAVDRNVWLGSGNAASYVTFADSTISHATVGYDFNARGRNVSRGSRSNGMNLEAESFMRLAPNVMAYGKAAYANTSFAEAGGSTIYGWETLQPFDIVELPLTDDGTRSTLGDMRLQMFHITGVVGWNVTGGLSIGASFDFNAGSFVKQKDLRHNNSLMNLDARFSVMQKISGMVSAGASFVYKRNTETIQYKTYGTTDQTYSVLVDYANGMGIKEMFGENGFTDGKQEQPLVNDNVGTNVQLCLKPLENNMEMLLDFTYLHRNGYYGKESQFTASHAHHTGNSYLWKARLNLPSADYSHVTMVEGNLCFHDLTAYATNYRQTKDQNNNAIIRYEYYTPTKISDRYLMTGNVFLTSYLGKWESAGKRPTIYPWRMQGGVGFSHSKQTGYLGLGMDTHDFNVWTPFFDVKRNFPVRSTDVLSLEIGTSYQMPSSCRTMNKGVTLNATASYELPMKQYHNVRPLFSLGYGYSEVLPYRHYVVTTIAVTF